MARIIFIKANVVTEVASCALDYADQWVKLRGYDGWVEATTELADPLREVYVGDSMVAPQTSDPDYRVDVTKADVTRNGIKFVTAGVKDQSKLNAASADQAAMQKAAEDAINAATAVDVDAK